MAANRKKKQERVRSRVQSILATPVPTKRSGDVMSDQATFTEVESSQSWIDCITVQLLRCRYSAISWTLIAMFFTGFVPILFGTLRTNATPNGMLSFEFARTGGIARVMMDVWGPNGRRAAWVSLGCDAFLLSAYSALVSGWVFWMASRTVTYSRTIATLGRMVAMGQIIAGILNLVKIVLLASALWQYLPTDNPSRWILPAAAFCASAKFGLLLLGVIYFLAAATTLTEVRQVLSVAWYMRFSLVIAALVPLILVLSPQGQESLRVLAENWNETPGPTVWFMGALIIFSTTTWYWSRSVGFLVAHEESARAGMSGPSESVTFSAAQSCGMRFIPVVCLITPLLLSIVAVYQASRPMVSIDVLKIGSLGKATVQSGAQGVLTQMTVAMCGILVVAGFLGIRDARRTILSHQQTSSRWWNCMSRRDRCFLAATCVPGIILFAIVGFTGPLGCLWTRSCGAPAILLLATASWVPIGSVLVVIGVWTRVPWTFLAILFAFLFSWFDMNDNHEIRRLGSTSPPSRDIYPSLNLENSFPDWLKNRPDLDQFVKRDASGRVIEGEYPVFFIAAEGGGIRAAYQTAMVLATLQDTDPRFADHAFCISGVSGGSLGAAVYGALATDGDRIHHGRWRERTDAVLSRDLLSPLVAASLSPDLIQRFLGWPVARFDRARALEYAMEAAWREAVPEGDDRFSKSLYDFCDEFGKRSVPALFLNTTDVRTGERMVVSTHWFFSREPLDDGRLPMLAEGESSSTPSLAELLYGESATDISLSTAATLSARFPYLTPCGFIATATGTSGSQPIPKRVKHRFVDGGYFDNSGLTTIEDVILLLQENSNTKYWKPIILRIGFGGRATWDNAILEQTRRLERMGMSHDDADSSAKSRNPEYQRAVEAAERVVMGAEAPASPTPGAGLDDILTPPRTFLATWDGHTRTESRRLRSRVWDPNSNWRLIEFSFFEYDAPLPLGWLLSKASRDDIQWQLAGFDSNRQPVESTKLKNFVRQLGIQSKSSSNDASMNTVLDVLDNP